MKMITHKFRLYPSKAIEEKLLFALEICRRTYNFALGELNSQSVIDKSLIQASLPDLAVCEPCFGVVYQKTLQYEVYKLFSNLSGLSASKKRHRKVGSLRFKGKGYFKTFTYNQLGFKLIDSGKRCQTLFLSKIGNIPIRCHRNIGGRIKQVTVKHFPSGKWYAFIVEDGRKEPAVAFTGKSVGIDLGSDDIVHDSDDIIFTAPKHYRKKEKRLGFLQRKFSSKIKGSNNRNRYRLRLAVQHESVSNSRDDFLHKLSRHYVNKYDYIGVEDFDITKMVNGRYAKGNLDAGWGKLRQYISYKAESAGKRLVGVEYRGTTQRCSQCGTNVYKEIWDRWHSCPECGLSIARDYNSALEVKRLMIEAIRLEQPDLKRLETEALPVMATSVYEE